MTYTTDMGSGAMIYIQSFIKTGSGVQKLLGRTDGKVISKAYLYFFKIKKVGSKQ
jgi:hypothetical protein